MGRKRQKIGATLLSESARLIYVAEAPPDHLRLIWPSGLRRGFKAPVRKGVGSNPSGFKSISLGGQDT